MLLIAWLAVDLILLLLGWFVGYLAICVGDLVVGYGLDLFACLV